MRIQSGPALRTPDTPGKVPPIRPLPPRQAVQSDFAWWLSLAKTIEHHMALAILMLGCCAALLTSWFMVAAAFVCEAAPAQAAAAGIACAFGITARILQAEAHQLRK